MAQQQQDVDTLKRRGRRRLVGAVALVLLAVIVLPMVFDPEPRNPGPPVSVRIPGEDDTPFKPKAVPEKKPPAEKNEAVTPKKEAVTPKKEVVTAAGEFVVPVGAFANPESVIAKLVSAKLPYFTEEFSTAKGKVTRVRAGPFASRDAAEKAAEKLKGLGLQPGTVTAKSG
jgi:DedD protein